MMISKLANQRMKVVGIFASVLLLIGVIGAPAASKAFADSSYTAYSKAVYDAELKFSQKVIDAKKAYDKVKSNPTITASELAKAKMVYNKAVSDAKAVKDKVIAEAQAVKDKAAAVKLSNAVKTKTEPAQVDPVLKKAKDAYAKSITDAKKIYEKALAAAKGNEIAIQKAKDAYNNAISKAMETYKKAKAK